MNDTIPLGHVDEIPIGEGRNYEVGDRRVAVFRLRNGKVYATQATCPHRQGPLADGLTENDAVICPLHDHKFNLATGEGIGQDCRLQTYPIRICQAGTMHLSPISETVIESAA